MESLTLSSVSTIMGIVRDILSAVETASQNKSRCKKVAERVRCIKDILEALQVAPPAQDGTAAAADAATRRLLDRLEDALVTALQVVRGCQRSVVVFFASGRMAESLACVERDIDRCILDLALANSLRIAHLETLLIDRQKNNDDVAAASSKDGDNTTPSEEITSAAIGVPVCTTATAVVHEHGHEMVSPPSSSYGCYHGYCSSCRSYHYHRYYYPRNHGCGACDCRRDDGDAGGLSAFYDTHRYSWHQYPPSMFSDDDPNSCSVM